MSMLSVLVLYIEFTVFLLMFSNGVNLPADQLYTLWHRPRLLIRSLIAVVVLVPVVVILVLIVFDLPAEVSLGLVVLAAAPGSPLITQHSKTRGGSLTLSAGLQLTLVLLAVLITPLTLELFDYIFDFKKGLVVSHLEVAKQVATVSLLPVSIGLGIQIFLPKLAKMIGKPLKILASVLFIILILAVILILTTVWPTLRIGVMPIAAIVIMAVSALVFGHLLGGPIPQERGSVAIAAISRNIGLSFFIVVIGGIQAELLPTIIVYAILGPLIAIGYAILIKPRNARTLPYLLGR
ncbi:MAG: sodium dependent transporter [Candidatus Dadabacteria bacterium]